MLPPLRDITDEDYAAWLDHPVTEMFLRYCNAKRFELMNQWAQGHFTDSKHEGTAQMNAEALGKAQVYGELLALQFEQISEGTKE